MLKNEYEKSIKSLISIYKNIEDLYFNVGKNNITAEFEEKQWVIIKSKIIETSKNDLLNLSRIQLELLFKYILNEANILNSYSFKILSHLCKEPLQSEIKDSIQYYLKTYKKKKLVFTRNIQNFLQKYDLLISDIYSLSQNEMLKVFTNENDRIFLETYSKKHQIFFIDKIKLNDLLKTKESFLNLSARSKEILMTLDKLKINIEDLFALNFNYNYIRATQNISNLGQKTLNELKSFLNDHFLKNNSDLLNFFSKNDLSVQFTSNKTLLINDISLIDAEPNIFSKSDNVYVEDLSNLSDDVLTILFSDVKYMKLSKRSNGALENFGIQKIGQIIHHGLNRLRFLPNLGRNSEVEILEKLDLYCKFNYNTMYIEEWPSKEKINQIISQKSLLINRLNLISFPNAKFIEDEVEGIFKTITEEKYIKLLKDRYGINDNEISHTLNDLGQGEYLGSKVTRERIRQIINKKLNEIENYKFDLPLYNQLHNFLRKKNIFVQKEINDFCLNNKLSKYINPSNIINVYNKCIFPKNFKFQKVYIKSINEIFFIKEIEEKILLNFFREINNYLHGKLFFILKDHRYVKEKILSLDECENIILNCKHYIVIKENNVTYICKRIYTLDGKKNKISGSINRIFRVAKKVDFQFLFAGLKNSRFMGDEKYTISFNLFEQYIKKLNLFKFENNYITLPQRPRANVFIEEKNKVYKLLFNYFLLHGRNIDTKTFLNNMIKQGISSNQSRVIYHTSCFIAKIIKGHLHKAGEAKFVFEKENLYSDNWDDIFQENDQNYDTEIIIKFKNNIKLKIQGLLSVKEYNDQILPDGNYKLFDEELNYQYDLRVSSNIIYGINNFVKQFDDESFELTFLPYEKYFIIKNLN